jgi:hypothetical protein
MESFQSNIQDAWASALDRCEVIFREKQMVPSFTFNKADRLVWQHLAHSAHKLNDTKALCSVTRAALPGLTQLSKHAVNRSLLNLEERGMLVRERPPHCETRIYLFAPPRSDQAQRALSATGDRLQKYPAPTATTATAVSTPQAPLLGSNLVPTAVGGFDCLMNVLVAWSPLYQHPIWSPRSSGIRFSCTLFTAVSA